LINAPTVEEVKTGLLDEYGKPLSKGVVDEKPIQQLIPDRVNKMLSGVDQVPEKQSYFDLVKLRNRIYDEVDSPEPISSQGQRLLKSLGAAVTEELNNAAKVLKPETVAKINRATEFYRDNVESFYQKGINDMLKPRTESGAVDPEAVATRLLAGGKGSVTTYNTVKDFFKNDPTAATDMKRVLRDHVLDSGSDTATGQISIEALTSAVSKLEPEIVQELFGQPKAKLLETVRQANLVLRTNSGGKLGGVYEAGTQRGIETDALKQLIDSGRITSPAIKKLLISNQNLRAQYSNAIRRAVQANDMGVVEASPETFVNQFLFDTKIPISDLRSVMASIYRNGNQPMIDNIRRSYLSKVFSETSKTSKGDVQQVVNRLSGQPSRNLDVEKLSLYLSQSDTQARLKLILGNDGFDGLIDFAKSISGRSARDKAMSLYGSLAGGAWFNKLLKGEGLSEIPHYAMISHLVTSPQIAKLVKSGVQLKPLQLDLLIKSAAVSPEMLQAVATESRTPQEARQYAKELRALATGQ
jgi:nucleoside-triphosphatase THEP1